MIMRKTNCLLFCILLGITMIPGFTEDPKIQQVPFLDSHGEDKTFKTAYTLQTPVDINNDTALASFASSGTGTSGDPFILGGWNITTESQNAIDITGTTLFFEIRNCWIDKMGSAGVGLYVHNLPTNTCIIEDVHVQKSGFGIYAYNSDSVDIIDCTTSDCSYGFKLNVNQNSTIQNSEASFCTVGIDLMDSDYTSIINTTCKMNEYSGLNHLDSGNIKIYNSTFSRTNWNEMFSSDPTYGWGIKGTNSPWMVLYNCTFEENDAGAIQGDTCSYGNFTKNRFLKNYVGLNYISSTGLIIRNNTFDSQGLEGLYINQCNAATIANNTIMHNGNGFTINKASGAICANNTIIDDGLKLYHDSIALYDFYVIENNTVNGKPLVYMIHENDTTAPSNAGQLIMINCTRVNATGLDCSDTSIGIFIKYSNYIRITDTVVNDVDYYAVLCEYSNYNTFRKITSTNQRNTGIYLGYGIHNLVDQCEIRNSDYYGIAFNNAGISTVSNGTIDNCQNAFLYSASEDIIIYNNTISNGYFSAFYFTNWYNFSIVKNRFINDGIFFGTTDLATNLKIAANITDNTVNGRPLGIYTNLRGGEITSAHGGLFLFNCSDVSIYNQNCSHTSVGILAKDCSNISVYNSELSYNQYYGMLLLNAAYSHISGSTCRYNRFRGIIVETSYGMEIIDNQIRSGYNPRGISLKLCPHAIVKDNIVSNCTQEGIYLENSEYLHASGNDVRECLTGISVVSSSSSTILENTVEYNSIGIEAYAVENVLVSKNEVHYNTLDGIYHSESPSTIGNMFTLNRITNNGRNGFNASQTVAPLIAYNTIIDNADYGVFLNGTTNGRIHHNYFINNNAGLTQGYDESSTATTWYDGPLAEGNYWSNYDLSGTYIIDGPASSSDLYPLVAPDSDLDGLSDEWEILNGLDPFSSDSDSDSIPDKFEVDNGLDPLTDDSSDDLDEDDLTNLEEYQLGLQPNNPDSDSDLMPDGFEHNNGLNPLFDDTMLDADSDGLSNLEEYELGTDVNSKDSDADSIPDAYEVYNSLNPLANDSASDRDNDTLSNLEEYNLGTSANNSDSDDDSMPDAYEVANSLNPLLNDASLDLDGDGLSNYDEMLYGTKPDAKDSDNDMMDDFFEIMYGLNALVSDAGSDLDNDNLTNYQEYLLGLNPNNIDSDGDLIPDSWEVENYLNPLYDDASLDPDGDGVSNYEEFLAGTNPWVAAAVIPSFDFVPIIIGVGAFAGGMVILYLLLHLKKRRLEGSK